MAATQQIRQPGQSATQTTPLARENPLSGGAALSIRLWTAQEAGQTGESFWKSNDPLACLFLDLITASLGVPYAPPGKFLVASFPDIQTAILTARRLQWAVQGLSESDKFAGTAAAVLVHSTGELPALEADDSLLLPLEHAAPGQILLTPKASELLQDLPGLALQESSETGLRELVWNGLTNGSSRSADEQILSEFIKLHGLEQEAPAPPEEPAAPLAAPLPDVPDAGPSPLAEVEESAGSGPGVSASGRRGKLPLFIGAACVAAIVLVIAAIVVFSPKKATNAQPKVVQPASSATDARNPAHQANPGAQTKTGQKTEEPAKGNAGASEAAKSQATAQKAAGGKCDLDSNLLPKMLEQAERSREQGKYPAAERQFLKVLACEPNNPQARSGLDRTRLDMKNR